MANHVDARFGHAPIAGPRGCLFGPGLFAMALIGGGMFAMSNWDTLSGFGRTGAVILVVLGTLMLLPVLVLLCVKLYVDRMFKQLMKSGTILDLNQTIIVDQKVREVDVIDAIGPGEVEPREKPPT